MCENIFAFLQLQFQMYVQSEKFLKLGEKSSRDPIWRTDDEDDSRIFFCNFLYDRFSKLTNPLAAQSSSAL